jgi:signal transduction histidine kinase
LQDIFDQLRRLNAPGLVQAGVALVIKPSPLVLRLDPHRFPRVLQNLVSNAAEVLADRPHGRIAIAARRLGRRCVLTIADNGPGIPPEIRSTLFEPFVTHGKIGGTGLGLAIARTVVEAHQGTIDFRSSKAGTTFIIELPLMA